MAEPERLYVKYLRQTNNLLPNSEEPFSRASVRTYPPQIDGGPTSAIEVRLDPGHRVRTSLFGEQRANFYVDTRKPKSTRYKHDGAIEIYEAETSEVTIKDSPVIWVLDKVLAYYQEVLRDHGLAGIPWAGTHDPENQRAQLQVERISTRSPHIK